MTDTPDASRVLVAMRVAATPDRAFVAFTEQIGRWWRHNGMFQFVPDRSGTMVFECGPTGRLVERFDDGSEFVVGDVRRWDPPNAFVIGWRQTGFAPDQDTELHVSFAETRADPAQTRVTVEHFGWDRIPPANQVRHGFPLHVFSMKFAEWWRAQLSALSDAVR